MSNNAEIAQKNTQELSGLDKLDTVGLETLMALLQCKTQVEAAKKLSISHQALWGRMKKYDLYSILREFPKQALMKLQLGATAAAEKLVEQLDDKKDGLAAAIEILDRVGLVGKGNGVNVQVNVTPILGGSSVHSDNRDEQAVTVVQED